DMALHHHSDAGALTVLAQDDVGGLQVRHGDGWIDVKPITGAVVINTGDIMQVWSNDRFQAALHRVSPRTNQTRYSLPYFFNPSYDTVYAPLNGAVADGVGARYKPINWGDFRHGRAEGDFADYGPEVQISDYAIG
ncbi:MAG: 2OG-Fe(II) oxygenase family protein, partial [Acidimicrobiales bacterium]